MKIGKMVTVMNGQETYRTKIVDLDKQYIYLDTPVHIKTEKSTYLPVKTPLQIKYASHDGAAYKFSSKVVNHKLLKVPTVVILLPEKIKRIQRREFVRIQINVDIAVHREANHFRPFTTVTLDISGGGVSIVLPATSQLKVNDYVELWFVLHMYNEDIHYITSKAKLLRLIDGDSAPSIGSFKFTNISEHDQQLIVQFCLEKQREARQKELQ